MHVLIVNPSWNTKLRHAEELLAAYPTLTNWSAALIEAGAPRVSVLQPFWRDANLRNGGVDYLFRRVKAVGWRSLFRDVIETANPEVVHINGLMFPRLT